MRQSGPLAQAVEHLTFNQGVGGSSPPWLTIRIKLARVAELADAQDLGSCVERRGGSSPFPRTILCGSGSVVEHRLAKARVAGSNPVFRSRKVNLGIVTGVVVLFFKKLDLFLDKINLMCYNIMVDNTCKIACFFI